MKFLIATIFSATLLMGCNGMGRDSDDPGTGPGNDTMRMQTHGIDLHENTPSTGSETSTEPDSTLMSSDSMDVAPNK